MDSRSPFFKFSLLATPGRRLGVHFYSYKLNFRPPPLSQVRAFIAEPPLCGWADSEATSTIIGNDATLAKEIKLDKL